MTQLREALVDQDPALKLAHDAVPPIAWRLRPGGFVGLLQMIVEQQVSTHAAAAIWARVETGLGDPVPDRVLALSEEDLRGFGLSRPKVRYARALAEACRDSRLDFAALPRLADAIRQLTAVPGIGLWTAELYLMFCEGRLSVFPGGDIALQEAMRWADRLEARPDTRAAYARAEVWQPNRAVAAHLLWAWYGRVKRGEVPHPMAEHP
ncbi:MAG: DNA-3-methyladenine glycosylase family protein [Asticcacaulis sp.]